MRACLEAKIARAEIVHIDASLIRADVGWESLVARHVEAVAALLRARRRRERWSEEDRRLYQRHRWRVEGVHGEAKTWHGLARAVRRGLPNMQIQAYLTAAATRRRSRAR